MLEMDPKDKNKGENRDDGKKEVRKKNDAVKKKEIILVIVLSIVMLLLGGIGAYAYMSWSDDAKEGREETEDERDEDTSEEGESLDEEDDEVESDDVVAPRESRHSIAEEPAVESSGCSDLTSDELSTVSGWSSISNATHGYSFKYPADWTVDTTDPNRTTLSWIGGGSGEEASFDFLSGPAATVGFAEYTLISEDTLEIACETAVTTLFSYDPNGRMYVASFNVDGTQHVILYSFGHINAGYDSNMIEQGELMMRTIEF